MSVQRNAVIFAWILLLPAVLYVAVIVAYPLVDTFILSFTDASLKKTTNWVGWVNYSKIFNATFAEVIVRTFIWTFFSVSIKMIIGVFGATMLNSAVPGRALFRVLTMPPWIVPMAIGIFMWGWMYNGQFGMISGMLQRFGLVDAPVYLHRDDLRLYNAVPQQAAMFGLPVPVVPAVDHFYDLDKPLTFGDLEVHVHHTPGHCPGGVCLQIGTAGQPGRDLFVGDTLFAGSIGRTDLPGGDYETLMHSIRAVLFALGDDATVYPGHGPATTIGKERRTNPFLKS